MYIHIYIYNIYIYIYIVYMHIIYNIYVYIYIYIYICECVLNYSRSSVYIKNNSGTSLSHSPLHLQISVQGTEELAERRIDRLT